MGIAAANQLNTSAKSSTRCCQRPLMTMLIPRNVSLKVGAVSNMAILHFGVSVMTPVVMAEFKHFLPPLQWICRHRYEWPLLPSGAFRSAQAELCGHGHRAPEMASRCSKTSSIYFNNFIKQATLNCLALCIHLAQQQDRFKMETAAILMLIN